MNQNQDKQKVRITIQNCDEATAATAREMSRRINLTEGVSCRAYVGKVRPGKTTRNVSIVITCDSPAVKAAIECAIAAAIRSTAQIKEGEA